MEVTGKIISIGDTQKVGQKQFPVREFVLETEEKYPQKLPIRVVGDKTPELNSYKEGDNVTVRINLKGREWNGKHFVNIEAWSFTHNVGQVERQGPGPEHDGLPF